MWPFRRKKATPERQRPGFPCPCCGSTNSRLIVCHGADHPDYIKVWRGYRSVTCRCLDCGRDFYSEEPQAEVVEEMMEDGRLVDDEEALRAAEEAVRKQAEDERERRRWY